MRYVLIAGGLLGLIPAEGLYAGPDWVEKGDAGSTLSRAQAPKGSGPIHSISGTLSAGFVGGDYEDMYIVGVVDPTLFSMKVVDPNFNAQLFMFHITVANAALGLLANDDRSADSNEPWLLPMATDGTGVTVDLPGDYLIAVSGFDNDPLSDNGLIFNQANVTEISGADGPGGLSRHTGWTGVGETGSYEILLDGASFPQIPGPGTLATVIVGLGAGIRRRRA